MTGMAAIRKFLLALPVFCSFHASADVLLIEQVRQAGRMDLPVNGQTMGEVEGLFGAPEQKHTSVGDPPITRWDYDRWRVYFEFDKVLFTVLNEGEVIGSEGSEDSG